MKIKISGLDKLNKNLQGYSNNMKNLAKELEDVEHVQIPQADALTRTYVAPDDRTALLEAIIRSDHADQARAILKAEHHMSDTSIDDAVEKIKLERKKDKIKKDHGKAMSDKIKRALKP